MRLPIVTGYSKHTARKVDTVEASLPDSNSADMSERLYDKHLLLPFRALFCHGQLRSPACKYKKVSSFHRPFPHPFTCLEHGYVPTVCSPPNLLTCDLQMQESQRSVHASLLSNSFIYHWGAASVFPPHLVRRFLVSHRSFRAWLNGHHIQVSDILWSRS
jgi:hypothetical protein